MAILSALLTDKSKGHCFLGGVAYISEKAALKSGLKQSQGALF